MKSLILGLVALFGIGCCDDAGNFPVAPGQSEAIAIALETLGAPIGTPTPPITWVEAVDLNCVGQTGPGWLHGSVCVDGIFSSETPFHHWNIELARKPTGIETTAIAHEIAHAYGSLLGNDDINHMSPMFCDAGEVGPCLTGPGVLEHGLVGIANKAIQAKGTEPMNALEARELP